MLYGEKAFDVQLPFLFSESEVISYHHILLLSKLFEGLIGKRKLVFVEAENSIEAISLIFSIIESGNIPMLLDANITDSSILKLINSYNPGYIMLLRPRTLPNFEEVSKSDDRNNLHLLANSLSKGSEVKNGELAMLIPTSGSTGSARYVKISYGNLLSQASSIGMYLGLSKESRTLTTLPSSYSYGFSILNSYARAGGQILVTEKNSVNQNYWELVDKHRINSISGVPFHYKLWKKTGFFEHSLPHLKTLTVAGGSLEANLKIEYLDFAEKMKIKFFVMYGQTEATARISYVPPERLRQKITSIGIPIPQGEIKILDESGKKVEEPRRIGELVYSGPNVTQGISENFHDLEVRDEQSTNLFTGDIGFFDENGYFYVVGRKKRFAKINGKRISLDEVENSLTEIGFESACQSDDNKIYVYYVATENISMPFDYLINQFRLLRSQLSFIQLSAIPRLPSGKINYTSLMEQREKQV
jgi:acyl-coenzyme A synthetase/AMP-(fatty) acid ligase